MAHLQIWLVQNLILNYQHLFGYLFWFVLLVEGSSTWYQKMRHPFRRDINLLPSRSQWIFYTRIKLLILVEGGGSLVTVIVLNHIKWHLLIMPFNTGTRSFLEVWKAIHHLNANKKFQVSPIKTWKFKARDVKKCIKNLGNNKNFNVF